MWIGAILWILFNYIKFKSGFLRPLKGLGFISPLILIYILSSYFSGINYSLEFVLRFALLSQLGVVLSLWVENGIGMENKKIGFVVLYIRYAFDNIKNITESFKSMNLSLFDKIKYAIEYLTWSVKVESESLSSMPPVFNMEKTNVSAIVIFSFLCIFFSVGEYIWLMF